MNSPPSPQEWLAPVIPLRRGTISAPRAVDGAPTDESTESTEYNSAMDLAMKYLGPRARSRREVGDRLQKAGHPGVLIVRILNRLEELGILDDAAYALEAARQNRARGKAGRAVRQALATKGLSRADIDSAVDQMCPEGSEFDLALAIATKRALKYEGLPAATAWRRLAGFLAGRGFSSELTSEICSRVLRDFPEGD
ncbi:MAG: regulatory protein RecX [Actinomycetota bacterium]